MLQSMRDNLKGIGAIIVAAFFGFIMVVGGIDFFRGASGGSADAVAEVNGKKITDMDLQRAIQSRQNMIRSQFGDQVPADLISEEKLRAPVLKQLVTSSVMRQAARDSGMVMSSAIVNREITQIPAFQVDGKFNLQRYRDGLRRLGYNTASFPKTMERDLILQQFADSVSDSAFTTRADANQIVALSMEERDFDYAVLPVKGLLGDMKVSDSEIEDYYKSHQAEFKRPEQVAIEYIELKPSLFAANVDVSEADVRAQYEQEAANFQAKPRRHAAHILIENSDAKKIAEVQSKLDAGEDFAKLAKTYSDDLGSSEAGGDLGFTTGDVFPEDFEKALASLKVGQVSAPVKTDAGTHFIKLLGVEGTKVPTYAERKAAISERLRNAQAEQQFVDALSRVADLTYNADTLKGPAEELGVPLETTAPFSRDGGTGIASNSKVIGAAFSPEVMLDGNTSEVLNLGNDDAVVLRVTEHKEAGTYPLEEVRDKIVDRLKRDKASQQLAASAKALGKQLEDGGDFAKLAKAQNLTMETADNTRRGGFGQRGEIITHAFTMKAPGSRGSLVSTFATGDGDQVVLRLRAVRPGNLGQQSSEQRAALLQQLSSASGRAELAAVQSYLSGKADIEMTEKGKQ
ncbi:SurA N-terminal domain-containing protein [Microbulbifer sp. SAOS-129_SWC]|uniref:SurA N-terminal domain-containing protein n=1 Tax=Microbulbifer sp. SAOS-129_SWC TaxID=3145235 RepID=UPI0032176D82